MAMRATLRSEEMQPRELAPLGGRGPGAGDGLPADAEAILGRPQAGLYAVWALAPREIQGLERSAAGDEGLAQVGDVLQLLLVAPLVDAVEERGCGGA